MRAFESITTVVAISVALLAVLIQPAWSSGRPSEDPTSEPTAQGHTALWQFYRGTLGQAYGDRCPMSPSCSAYAEDAIRQHGWVLGWIMTFDRFGHEGTEAQHTANGVLYRGDKLKAIDEIKHNDFWWAATQETTSSQLLQAGQTDLAMATMNLPSQVSVISDETLRATGKTLLKTGVPDQSAIVFVALWMRNKNPSDALLGALALLETGKASACAALLDTLVNAENVSNDEKVIAFFAQGLAFRKRDLFSAAAGAFHKAMDLTSDKSVLDLIRAYYVEAKLKADEWPAAAKEVENIQTSTAKAIRREMTEDLPWRSPALSGTMSALLPGSGQVYCGRYQEGFWAFVVCGVFAFASYEAFDHDLGWVGGATTLTGLSWYSGNIYGAISAAHKHNSREKDQRISNWIDRLGVQPGNGTLKIMLRFQF